MSDINIVFTRVDNRLVHGQVGNVWVTASGANLILVVVMKHVMMSYQNH